MRWHTFQPALRPVLKIVDEWLDKREKKRQKRRLLAAYKKMSYGEYLSTKFWKDLAKQVRERDDFTCAICKRRGWEVHHKWYPPRGTEKLDDLITLCDSCHRKLHNR